MAVECQHKDPPHNCRRLRINYPDLGAVRVLGVAIWRGDHRLTGTSSDYIADAPLFAYIPAVPLIKQVADRRKLVLALICVDGGGHGYEAYVVLGEKLLGQTPDLDVVSA